MSARYGFARCAGTRLLRSVDDAQKRGNAIASEPIGAQTRRSNGASLQQRVRVQTPGTCRSIVK